MTVDEKFMRRALQLAKNGSCYTSPNPMVGAVIVCDNLIIGEGYHRRCGEGHAEVNAVASVKNRELLKRSTMYVTLEPCSHYGKTPPCAKLIIENKIPNVVVGCLDPFDKVSGRGIKMLRDAGVKVSVGILEKECRELNRRFILAHALNRPMITLKWAQSKDGYIDCLRSPNEPAMRFSTDVTSTLVHKMRAEHDAIMVGSGTVISDNPRLNVRHWDGRNPQIVIIDRRMRISPDAHIFSNNPIYMSSAKRDDLHFPVQWVEVEHDCSINECLSKLYSRGITSLLIEGGAMLLKSFLDCGLWDNARIEISPIALGEKGGIKAPEISGVFEKDEEIDGNEIVYYKNYRL